MKAELRVSVPKRQMSLVCLGAKRRSMWVQCGEQRESGTDEAGEVEKMRAAGYGQTGCAGHSSTAQ